MILLPVKGYIMDIDYWVLIIIIILLFVYNRDLYNKINYKLYNSCVFFFL